MREIDKIIIHCSDSNWGEVEEITHWHVDDRGYRNIGYHFVICNQYPYYRNLKRRAPDYLFDGKVENGRPVEKIGAHCRKHNRNSIGICLIGTGIYTNFQLTSLRFLIEFLMIKYAIQIDNIYGHYEFDSSKTCPIIDMTEFRKEIKV